MNKKSIWISMLLGVSLFLLSGCGFKVDEKTLSNDDGIYLIKVKGKPFSIIHFNKKGQSLEYAYDNTDQTYKLPYSVSEDKGDHGEHIKSFYKISFPVKDGDFIYQIPKDDHQSINKFKAIAMDPDGNSYNVVFEKKDKEYLDNRILKVKKEKKKELKSVKKSANKLLNSISFTGSNTCGSLDETKLRPLINKEENKIIMDEPNNDASKYIYEIEMENNSNLENGEVVKAKVLVYNFYKKLVYTNTKNVTVSGLN